MSTQYSWKITGKKKIDQGSYKDVIVQVYWTKTGTSEDGRIGHFHGCTSLSLDHTAPGDTTDFVEYEDVSDELLIGWVSDFILSIEGLSQKIDDHIQNDILNIAPANVWR
jgi:hypothetical protein